jgi:phosphoglycerate dehydrogenase-like enzyme
VEHPARRIAVYPDTRPAMFDAYASIVDNSPAERVDLRDADALLWADPHNASAYPEAIATAPRVGWIQLPYAGIEPFLDYLDHDHLWTCAKGVYSEPVAEHVIALALSGMRNLHEYARAQEWSGPVGTNLLGAHVTILGAGGITESLLRLLGPWGCTITVVRRQAVPMAGADRTVALDELDEALASADVVIVALALTEETTGILNAAAFSTMKNTAWLVNVGRGGHVVTDELVAALENNVIAGAALDVTDPEPLAPDHRLWHLPNALITPHTANTPEMGLTLLKLRIEENVRRYCAHEELLGLVNVDAGY